MFLQHNDQCNQCAILLKSQADDVASGLVKRLREKDEREAGPVDWDDDLRKAHECATRL